MNPDEIHNPENIASPGEGWRFLRKSELKELPMDAEYASCVGWTRSFKANQDATGCRITYRTRTPDPLAEKAATEKAEEVDCVILTRGGNRLLSQEEAEKRAHELSKVDPAFIFEIYRCKLVSTIQAPKEQTQEEKDNAAFWRFLNTHSFAEVADTWKAALAYARGEKKP